MVVASCGLVAVAGCGGSDAPAPGSATRTGATPTQASGTPAAPAPGSAPRTGAAPSQATPTQAARPRVPVDRARTYRRAVAAGRRQIVLAPEIDALAGGGGWAAWIADEHVAVRAPGRPPRTLQAALPPGTDELAVGPARDGTPTLVLAASERGGPLRTMPADDSAPPVPVRFAAAGRADAAPGIRRGIVTFTRTEQIHGRLRHTVRTARLTGRRSVRVWPGAAHTTVTATAPTSGGAAFVTADDAYEYGSSHTLRLVRAGAPPRTLADVRTGEMAPGGFGALQTTPDGTRVTSTRWTDDQRTHPWDVTVYRVADAAVLSRRHPPDRREGDWGVDVPDGRIHTDMALGHDGQSAATGSLVLRRR